MAETVLTAIELCKLIADIGQTVYDASTKVANNFSEQRRELGRKVNTLKTRVKRLQAKLDQRHAILEDSANIRDLNKLLKKIRDLFQRIQKFFSKLEKYESKKGIMALLKKAMKYYQMEHEFEDYNLMLVDYEENLNLKQRDIGFEELLDTHLVVHDLMQEQRNRLADAENLKNFIREGIKSCFLSVLHDENSSLLRISPHMFTPVSKGKQTDSVASLTWLLQCGFTDQMAFMEEYMRKCQFNQGRISPDSNLPSPISPDEISEEEFLSEGNYFTISTAILDKEKVTVKRVRDVDDHNVQASFKKETVNLMRFSRGSIVRVIGMCDNENEKFLVLEYMEKGDLSTLLHKSGEEISLYNKVTLATTAARAFYCMYQKLVHSSLRTEKFLVDKYYTAKLSGMAYAKTFSSTRRYQAQKPVVDHTRYLAPELYQPNKLSPEVDVYGYLKVGKQCSSWHYKFGIVLWEIFTQSKPFSTLEKEIGRDPNHAEVKKFVVVDKREEYDVGSGPVEIMVGKLIRDCRALDPKKRPKVPEILDQLERISSTLEDLED